MNKLYLLPSVGYKDILGHKIHVQVLLGKGLEDYSCIERVSVAYTTNSLLQARAANTSAAKTQGANSCHLKCSVESRN